jgi:hypothetical protein
MAKMGDNGEKVFYLLISGVVTNSDLLLSAFLLKLASTILNLSSSSSPMLR